MKNFIIKPLIVAGIGLFSLSSSAQLLPTQLLPEIVCKETHNEYFYGLLGLQIIGETLHPSCRGSGNNAWIVKLLEEEGDVVCRTDYSGNQNHLDQILKFYNGVGVNSPSCPALAPAYGVSNALELTLKQQESPYNLKEGLAPLGYIPIAITSSGQTIIRPPRSSHEKICRRNYIPGYVQIGQKFYTPDCDQNPEDNIRANETRGFYAPGDTARDVLPTGYYPLNYVATEVYDAWEDLHRMVGGKWVIVQAYAPLAVITKATTEPSYIVCAYNFSVAGLPLGYRFTEKQTSSACQLSDNSAPYQSTNGVAWKIERIDVNSVMDICLPSSLARLPSSKGQTIPSTHVKTRDFYSEKCPSLGVDTQGQQLPNTWHLQPK